MVIVKTYFWYTCKRNMIDFFMSHRSVIRSFDVPIREIWLTFLCHILRCKTENQNVSPHWGVRTLNHWIERPVLYHWATSSLLQSWHETCLQNPIATNHSKCEDVIFLYIQKIMIVFFLDFSGVFWWQLNCSNLFPESNLLRKNQ